MIYAGGLIDIIRLLFSLHQVFIVIQKREAELNK
jgi:hypothetical protein